MKLTLSDGRVFETSDPSHRLALMEIQHALLAFRIGLNGVPEDPAHPAYPELVREARVAGERCVRAYDAFREMLVALGAGESAVDQLAPGPMSEVRSFLADHDASLMP